MEWSELTPVEWESTLQTVRWDEFRDGDEVIGWSLSTACPRCKSPAAVNATHHATVISDRGARAPSEPVEIYVECGCSEEHPGRPAGERGCGQRASILFTIPDGVVA